MKVKFKKEVEADARFLHVDAQVRYWEDSSVDGVEDEKGELIPCRVDDLWKPIIDIDKGIITNWEKGKTAEIHYKICDAGIYTITDGSGEEIIKKYGYVPKILCPCGGCYGDYIIMSIDAGGLIENFAPDLGDIFETDEN